MPPLRVPSWVGVRVGRMQPLTIRASFLDLAVFALQGERNLVRVGIRAAAPSGTMGGRRQGAARLWGGCRGWVHAKEGGTDRRHAEHWSPHIGPFAES